MVQLLGAGTTNLATESFGYIAGFGRFAPSRSRLVSYLRAIRALASRARQQAVLTALAAWRQRSLTVAARKLPSRDTCACEPRALASGLDCFSGVAVTLPHGRGS